MKYNGETVTQNTESNDLDTLSIDELHGSLLVHEQRMQEYHADEQALKVTYDSRPGQGRGGRSRGRTRQPMNKALIECYKCHKLGHFQYECPDFEKTA
ncbi:hypothetical protein LXL04_009387 [Taraxacum kok-saghyz]